MDPSNSLKYYSLTELEALATGLYSHYKQINRDLSIHYRIPNSGAVDKIIKQPSLIDVLSERRHRLNREYQFTAKSKRRFVQISNKLMECFGKAWAEAKPMMDTFEGRLKENDSSLRDYEIELIISPFLERPQNTFRQTKADVSIQDVLEEILQNSHILKTHAKNHKNGLYMAKNINWNNIDTLKNHKKNLSKYYIGYPMHELCDHSMWSLPDVLKITNIWVDVKIECQHYITVTMP